MEAVYNLAKKHKWNKAQLDALLKKKRLTKAEYDNLIEKLESNGQPHAE